MPTCFDFMSSRQVETNTCLCDVFNSKGVWDRPFDFQNKENFPRSTHWRTTWFMLTSFNEFHCLFFIGFRPRLRDVALGVSSWYMENMLGLE